MTPIHDLIDQWHAEAEACETGVPDDATVAAALKCRAAWSRLHANELEIALLAVEKAALTLRLNTTMGVN